MEGRVLSKEEGKLLAELRSEAATSEAEAEPEPTRPEPTGD
jgi:hypothetical protein